MSVSKRVSGFQRVLMCGVALFLSGVVRSLAAGDPAQLFARYCFDCHEGATAEGGFDLADSFRKDHFDPEIIFENLATAKMPPSDSESPSASERWEMLTWLAGRSLESSGGALRRISRREFVHSVNDLLGTEIDLLAEIPEDRGTRRFDTDRRIKLSRELIGSYFAVADKMLEHALPVDGFAEEQIWKTRKLQDSHETYNVYVRDYEEGQLFSWTRANNGDSYSFFYDDFTPPEAGWYELTFEVAKVGDLEGDVSIQVHAGKYFYADDRPQPQRLLDVISIGNEAIEVRKIRAFLWPGESVSVHCFHRENFQERNPQRGAYIRQMTARGPLQDQWPPSRYQKLFGILPFEVSLDQSGAMGLNSQRRNAPSPSDEVRKTKVLIGPVRSEDLQRTIQRFAERAFAAQLTERELKPYVDVAMETLRRDGDFIQAARTGFKAIVCSHRFLMVPSELSVSGASHDAVLARVLWRSIPNDEVRDSHGGLTDKISQMLSDRRSDRMIRALCDQWLNLRAWKTVSPSLKLYPLYDDLLEHYLPLETHAYLAYLIRENRPASELIDSDYSFLNQRLADHYGVEGVVGQKLRLVTFAPANPRGGLLTMGSVLKVTTDGFQTSPILRGAWISKNLVGTPISPPPESVVAIEPEPAGEVHSLRQQIELHKSNEACSACHKSIDPYGFALENFDATGQWRTQYRAKLPHRQTFQYRPQGYFQIARDVDASGELQDQPFRDIHGMKRILLAKEQQISYNFAKRFFEYANGYQPDLKQRLALLRMTPKGVRMKDLVIDVLTYSLNGN